MKDKPSKFWKAINPPSQSCPSSFIISDKPCSDNLSISEAFNDYFKSVFTRDDGRSPTFFTNSSPQPFPSMLITTAGVRNLVLKIDTTKSAGPDGIPNMFLKRYSEWTSRYLSVIFSKSVESSTVPLLWKCAKVVPIHKDGNKQVVCNYRPISLISTSCKLLEHIIYKYIIEYLSEQNILSHAQHGFRSGFSTVTQLLEFSHDIASTLNARGQLDAIFIDYRKAFDTVCHNKLLIKIKELIHDTKLTDWIQDYLSSRTQFVAFNRAHSSQVSVTSGVPQGSVLGPLLFIIYINDVVKVTAGTSVKLRLYADDCVIYSDVTSTQDQLQLNKVFDRFCEWSKTWQMSLNFKKTVSMTFSNKKHPLKFSYFSCNHKLESVDTFKYLGVTFTPDLKWHAHIQNTSNKALRKLGYLKRNLRDATRECKLVAYRSLIRPLLEYASVVWAPHHANDINMLDSIQKKNHQIYM